MFLYDISNSYNFVIMPFDSYLYSMLYNNFWSSPNLWNQWYGWMEGVHAMVYYQSFGFSLTGNKIQSLGFIIQKQNPENRLKKVKISVKTLVFSSLDYNDMELWCYI